MICRADHIGTFAYIQVVSHIKFKIFVIELGKFFAHKVDEHIGADVIMLVDVDSNRYTIRSVSALSPKSYRKIELYL